MMAPPEYPPEGEMKVTWMLADHAQVAEGKLNVIGGGWTFTGPMPTPFALAGIIEVPWALTNRKHVMRFELIDLDGAPVTAASPMGDEPVLFEGDFEAGRPPGVRNGSAIPIPFAINCGPLLLASGSHFEWRLTINGATRTDWRLAFSTRPEIQSMTG